MTITRSYISEILEGSYGKLSEEIKRVLGEVFSSSNRMVKIIRDFLDLSKIEMGKVSLKFEKTSLKEIISSLIEELKIAAKKKNLNLNFKEPEKPLPEILIDREKIRQAIFNVIDNAIKYTQKGGVKIEIQDLKSKVQIVISDTGVGLTKEELEIIFESFVRGEAGNQHKEKGIGMGLYIAKKLIELHQGKIWAESEGRAKGSTFYIELPKK